MPASKESALAKKLIIETRAYYCLECGKCTARCPISRVDSTFSPVLNVARALRGFDWEIKRDGGIWACMVCDICSSACPSNVDYPRFILGLRAQALKSGIEKRHLSELEQLFLEGVTDKEYGIYRDIKAVKTAIKGQDGGVVTSLLVEGMKKGLFDSAIVVYRQNGFQAEAVIAENVSDIRMAKGSKYQLVSVAGKLVEAVKEKGKKKIAVVGLPCQVLGIREIQKAMPEVEIFVIGLFCMENFVYRLLRQSVGELLKVDLDLAEKANITKGNFIVTNEGKQVSCKVSELQEAVRIGCSFCTDFTSRLADISVGSVGSPDGYSTVITRSRKGEELFRLLKDLKETSADRDEIDRLASWKERKGFEKLKQEFSSLLG
ncbi:MAG: Coenzyme F420 hydrogenase/dehydrogenase, beta subunit C-terminal domain [Methanoregula sp.]|nr:Coenzyme F420 hydrogenase/dehydrogenase, beta subunit C-terminal domain [Methanoregula sp.]